MPNSAHKNSGSKNSNTFEVGFSVKIKGTSLSGFIMEINQATGKCRVDVGGKILKLDLNKLQLNLKETKDKPKKTNRNHENKEIEIDLHGLKKTAAEEAMIDLINKALLQNANKLIIIHGHGEGVIKKVVHKFLNNSQFIASFKLMENNTGTTIAFLK